MAKAPEDRLTIRQELFLTEYLKDRNGKAAAIRAGYKPENAEVTASRNIRHPVIAAKIRENTELAKRGSSVDPSFVIEQLKRVAEQDDVAQSTKVRALELLAKHLGMLEDRISLKTDGLSSEQRAERVAILLERVRNRD